MGKILMYNNVIHVDYMMSGGFFLDGGGGGWSISIKL